MTKKKSDDSSPSKYEPQKRYARDNAYEHQTAYHRSQQPKNMERWNHAQFQQWVKDCRYPPNDHAPALPYSVAEIADDLKCSTGKVYTYWRGHDGKRDVTVPPSVVALCKALLELKRLRGGAS